MSLSGDLLSLTRIAGRGHAKIVVTWADGVDTTFEAVDLDIVKLAEALDSFARVLRAYVTTSSDGEQS